MAEKYTKQDLAQKVEWEGGLAAAIDYGIKHDELPDDTPTETVDAWRRLEADLATVDNWLSDIDDEDTDGE
jgi:hypothetical protein